MAKTHSFVIAAQTPGVKPRPKPIKEYSQYSRSSQVKLRKKLQKESPKVKDSIVIDKSNLGDTQTNYLKNSSIYQNLPSMQV